VIRKLMCVAPGKLAWQAADDPAVARSTDLRVRSEFAAPKHGTELAFYKGSVPARGTLDPEYQIWRPGVASWGYPNHMGNMIVGRVEEVGPDVKKMAVGDRVCLYSGFQEQCVVQEADVWKMPAHLSWKSAVCLDPADFAFGAVRDGHVRIGDGVAIFGLGAIGLMCIQFARLAGADPVIGVDHLANRRAVAEELGATLALDPAACNPALEIKKATRRRGVDVAIDFRGSVASLQAALRAVAFGGNVVAGAMPAPYPAGLDLGAESHINVPNLIFSRACSQPDRDHPRWSNRRIYESCWRLLCEGKVTGEPIVGPIVAFEDLLIEYPKIANHPDKIIKLAVRF
jgi:threonine dehydrogenase-like Zn-dependent dehydrogenase